jgi:hypothetical protein
MMATSDNEGRVPLLTHFLRLARRGKHPGASGGEARAYRLARAIVADAPGLDSTALAGAMVFVEFTSRNPTAAESMLED